MYSISIEHVDHSYGNKQVLFNYSFNLEPVRSYCILGPSGSGKTTVLRLIAGLETPGKGKIMINDREVSRAGQILVPPHKRGIGFIFQDLSLWPHFTVYKNIAFGLKERGDKMAEEKVYRMLRLFGITDHAKKYPHQLSGGQKQMVAIARSLVLEPGILLLDEPMANIDVHIKENIISHLYSLQEQNGFTMVYVTHDYREVIEKMDETVIMNEGRIVMSGATKDVLDSPDEFVRSFVP